MHGGREGLQIGSYKGSTRWKKSFHSERGLTKRIGFELKGSKPRKRGMLFTGTCTKIGNGARAIY